MYLESQGLDCNAIAIEFVLYADNRNFSGLIVIKGLLCDGS